MLADDLPRVLVVGVEVIGKRVQRDQSFNKQVSELDEEAELCDTGDQSVEILADAILHELDLLPLHQFTLSIVGAALGLARLFGDLVQLFQFDGAAQRIESFAVRGVIAALRPGRRGRLIFMRAMSGGSYR